MVSSQTLVPTVFIVDDEPSVCRCLARMARQAGFAERTFSSAEEFLAVRPSAWDHPACLILDLQMPGVGGLELQREFAEGPAPCPVIFVSGNGTIPATVQAMKQGAVTFLSKPFEHKELLQAMCEAFEKHRAMLEANSEARVLRGYIESLTQREREVMAWVITGALNKQIASELGIVERTVKVHRARVMEKMHAASVAQLVRLCEAAGFDVAGN